MWVVGSAKPSKIKNSTLGIGLKFWNPLVLSLVPYLAIFTVQSYDFQLWLQLEFRTVIVRDKTFTIFQAFQVNQQ